MKRPYREGLEALDPECRELAEALNNMPGVVTIGSCSGHGRREFFISFKIESGPDYENRLTAVMGALERDPDYRQRWRLEANHTYFVWFALWGPKSATGDGIAKTLRRYQEDGTGPAVDADEQAFENRERLRPV